MRRGSTTGVDGGLYETGLASDLATISEPALTIDLLLDYPRVVAPTATEELATFDARTGGVATPSDSTERSRLPIRLAEIRRVLAINQIESTGWLDGRTLGDEAVPVVARYHLRRPVERLLQTIADLAKGRHLSPAGAHAARARQPVALALDRHEIPHRLRRQTPRQTCRQTCRQTSSRKTNVVPSNVHSNVMVQRPSPPQPPTPNPVQSTKLTKRPAALL